MLSVAELPLFGSQCSGSVFPQNCILEGLLGCLLMAVDGVALAHNMISAAQQDKQEKQWCNTCQGTHDTHMAILTHILYVVCFLELEFVYVYVDFIGRTVC